MAQTTVIYIGTDDNKLLICDIHHQDGKTTVRKEIINAPNEYDQKPGAMNGGISTEWVLVHPKFDLLYAITSYWSKGPATLVTYKIQTDGDLEKIGSTSTCGYQGCHATFSPDGRYLAIAHYLDGKISIFRCSSTTSDHDEQEGGGGISQEGPTCVVELPGTRKPVTEIELFGKYDGPMCHGITYSPDGRHLTACNCSGTCLVTYKCDVQTGRLLADEETNNPPHILSCVLGENNKPHGMFMGRVKSLLGSRPRHMVYHPTKKFAYVVHEMANVVTWHDVLDERQKEKGEGNTGGILGEAGGEINTLSQQLKDRWVIGYGLNAVSELACSEDGRYLYVANRGYVLGWFGTVENSITTFAIDPDTGALTYMSSVDVPGIPRHFMLCDDQEKFRCLCSTGEEVTCGDDSRVIIVGGALTGEISVCRRGNDGTIQVCETTNVGYTICCIASKSESLQPVTKTS